MYPIEKYKFYSTHTKDGKKKVIAISTYAGKTVRGSAICDHGDEFSFEKGKQLAAARCAEKIATKRVKRAMRKIGNAVKMMDAAKDHYTKMTIYFSDARADLANTKKNLSNLLDSM